MEGTWDSKKKKYIKKEKEDKETKWIHKNNYVRTKWGILKGENTPYRKPKETEEE